MSLHCTKNLNYQFMRHLVRLTCLHVLLLLCHGMAFAQSQSPGSVFQLINVSAYQGSSFTMECMMYADRSDDNSGAALMCISTSKGKQINRQLGKLSMEDFKPGQWNKLTLKGKINKGVDTMLVGFFYSGQAKFLFDDLKMSVKSDSSILKDGGFEGKDLKTWTFFQTPKGVNISLTDKKPHTGSQALSIEATTSEEYGSNTAAGKYANINGNRIYYEVYGEGEPLLLLHGSSESIQSFNKQLPAFSKAYKVIAVDTRGHGKSTADTTRLSYDLYAEDMYQLLNELHLDKVNILGWSDGGNTGLILATKHPEKVKKLAVMGAVITADSTAVFGWVRDTVRSSIRKAELAPRTPKTAFAIRVLHSLLEEPNVDPAALKTIQCPVLVMAGEHDLIKQSHTELIARSIPSSTLVIFKNASHMAPWEIPDEFNKTVLDFLKK